DCRWHSRPVSMSSVCSALPASAQIRRHGEPGHLNLIFVPTNLAAPNILVGMRRKPPTLILGSTRSGLTLRELGSRLFFLVLSIDATKSRLLTFSKAWSGSSENQSPIGTTC